MVIFKNHRTAFLSICTLSILVFVVVISVLIAAFVSTSFRLFFSPRQESFRCEHCGQTVVEEPNHILVKNNNGDYVDLTVCASCNAIFESLPEFQQSSFLR